MISDELRSLIAGNLGHSPTAGQDAVITALGDYLLGRDDRIFLIKGYAGTGKTSLVASLVKSLEKFRYRSVLLAPTGRAAKVMSRYAGAPAYTIHKKIYRQKSSVDGFGEFSLDRNLHRNTLFIVDEAYHEFCGVTVAPLVERLPNLVVTRTFSKCFGIAGLRVGYVMACEAVLANLKKVHNPKSVNTLGQLAALAALSDRPFRDRYIQQVTEAREQLTSDLIARGACARATPANFVLVAVANPKRLVARLESEAVFVRDRSHLKGFEGYVRITVGTPEQMRDLITRLDRLLVADPDLLTPPN